MRWTRTQAEVNNGTWCSIQRKQENTNVVVSMVVTSKVAEHLHIYWYQTCVANVTKLMSVNYPARRTEMCPKKTLSQTLNYYPGQKKKAATRIVHKIRTLCPIMGYRKNQAWLRFGAAMREVAASCCHCANLVILHDKNSVLILCIIQVVVFFLGQGSSLTLLSTNFFQFSSCITTRRRCFRKAKNM